MRAYIFALMCVSFVNAYKYTAGVTNSSNLLDIIPTVYEAGQKNVDVLVITSEVIGTGHNYNEIVRDLSKGAKNAKLYLVANVNEKIQRHNKNEIVRSNIVFDRQGDIVSIYKKPVSTVTNSTAPTPALATFSTDFGVTFALMMEEDLVMTTQAQLKGVKNFLVTGAWKSEIPFLSASQLIPTWAYTMEANVVSNAGIYAGTAGLTPGGGKLVVAQLNNDGKEPTSNPPVVNTHKFVGEDLSQYIIKPLDVAASSRGYNQVVCHNRFCCEFFVKTSLRGSKPEDVNYGLAVFDGIRHFGSNQYIGTQNCAVFACAGLYKRTCTFGSVNNNTNVAFEELTVKAKFTKQNSIQYPVILSNDIISADQFTFYTDNAKNNKHVSVILKDNDNLLAFGIFGRDYNNDYIIEDKNENGFYDYIFNEDVQEFFDYIWIRLRILIFVVSIYVLEMM